MRRVTFSPPPPTQMGTWSCSGLGNDTASSTHACLPWWLEEGSLHIARTTQRVSSSSSSRCRAGGNVQPWERYSSSYHPAPIPKMTRPPESTSTVAACFARSAGFR